MSDWILIPWGVQYLLMSAGMTIQKLPSEDEERENLLPSSPLEIRKRLSWLDNGGCFSIFLMIRCSSSDALYPTIECCDVSHVVCLILLSTSQLKRPNFLRRSCAFTINLDIFLCFILLFWSGFSFKNEKTKHHVSGTWANTGPVSISSWIVMFFKMNSLSFSWSTFLRKVSGVM